MKVCCFGLKQDNVKKQNLDLKSEKKYAKPSAVRLGIKSFVTSVSENQISFKCKTFMAKNIKIEENKASFSVWHTIRGI